MRKEELDSLKVIAATLVVIGIVGTVVVAVVRHKRLPVAPPAASAHVKQQQVPAKGPLRDAEGSLPAVQSVLRKTGPGSAPVQPVISRGSIVEPASRLVVQDSPPAFEERRQRRREEEADARREARLQELRRQLDEEEAATRREVGQAEREAQEAREQQEAALAEVAARLEKAKREREARRTKIERERKSRNPTPAIGIEALITTIRSRHDDIFKLDKGGIALKTGYGYVGYIGYQENCVLIRDGAQWQLWIEDQGLFRCDLLKAPSNLGWSDSAERVYITDVLGAGAILKMLDGSLFQCDDTVDTYLWLGSSDALLINGSKLINLDEPSSIVDVERVN